MAGKIPASGKTKVVSSGKMTPVRGGSGHMLTKAQTAGGTQKPGTTATASRTATPGPFAKGGKGHMVGKQTVHKQVPGTTGVNGAKAGSKTGSGGGKRGTGTQADF